MEYDIHHIMDIKIEDETQRNGRDISIFVDTHEMVNIEIGNTITIRTDEAGVDDLRDALHRALTQIEDVRYTRMTEEHARAEEEMVQAGISAREKVKERSEQQRVDPYDTFNANDPVNW